MKIKREAQVRSFLIAQFGEDRGGALFGQQEALLYKLIANEQGKSESQMKTLTQTILPSVALYKTLCTSGLSQPEAYVKMRIYMLDYVAAAKHASTAKMEAVPGFYALYSKIFRNVMRKSDAWQSTQTCGKDFFDVTITKCLWHTACVENGCPELCPLFCDADNVTYDGLKKIGFSRTKTIGCGGDCCDFHFFKK